MTLLADAKKQQAQGQDWLSRLERVDPKFHKEFCTLLSEYEAGHLVNNFKSFSQLSRWFRQDEAIIEQLKKLKLKPPSKTQFRSLYVRIYG